MPTLVWMNAPGKWRAMARVAFRPVRWAGMITSGASCPSARTVPAMTVEQRPGQVEPADDRVRHADAGQALGVAADVDDAGVPAPGLWDSGSQLAIGAAHSAGRERLAGSTAK